MLALNAMLQGLLTIIRPGPLPDCPIKTTIATIRLAPELKAKHIRAGQWISEKCLHEKPTGSQCATGQHTSYSFGQPELKQYVREDCRFSLERG